MANWCGSRYAEQSTGVHYVAFSTICDDLCIPPLDLVQGRFRLYGRTVADLAIALDEQGWGPSGALALLSLVRQYVVQYLEKADRGLHRRLNALTGVWDAVVYRTHTANCYGAALVVARVCDAGAATFTWLQDSAICDAISMDLCKIAMDVYRHDRHQPTRTDDDHEPGRRDAYHSLYLDLIDDLVTSGAPEPLVHFGRAGFLFVQLQDRYHERRIGQRLPLRPAITGRLEILFGDTPTTQLVEDLFTSAATQ
jgi:hypothetical protein